MCVPTPYQSPSQGPAAEGCGPPCGCAAEVRG